MIINFFGHGHGHDHDHYKKHCDVKCQIEGFLVGIVGVVSCWLDPPADMSAADMLTC